ncbi:MAG: GNAT family N-acetyltransferase [Candidatus Competibacteraceae bacterium]|nr:GNAT family N-acetyltransferase [Candidatus Competibacteraceae bacterium]
MNNIPNMIFHPAYQEALTVADGNRLRLRLIRPADKSRLKSGFQRLSESSRYCRFFSHKSDLTQDDLRFMTEFDGTDHAALGVFELNEAGIEGDAVGVGRYIRLPNDPTSAEFSLAVTDDQQDKGIGRLLLQRLLSMAAERGFECFEGYVLPENDRMTHLIKGVRQTAQFHREDGLLKTCFPTANNVDAASSITMKDQVFQ